MPRHSQSLGERVIRHLLLIAEIFAGAIVFSLTMGSIVILLHHEPSRFKGPIIPMILLCVGTAIIFATAERWGGFVPGFLFLGGASKAFFYAAISQPFNLKSDFQALDAPATQPARLMWLALGFYCVLAILLLWRFLPPHKRRATMADRAALTGFALAFMIGVISPWPESLRILLLGLLLLVIAWLLYFLKRRAHRHHRVDGDPPQPVSTPV